MFKSFLALFVFGVLIIPFFASAEGVDINTASLEQLETLTGIGAVKAQAIIGARPFSSVDDLLRVKGIGEKTLQKIKEQGLAYVGEKSEIRNPKSETNSNDQNPNEQNATEPGELGAPAGAPSSNASAPDTYPGGIFINEIMPSPEGPDEENEWIELYNSNSFEVDLTGWKIQDFIGAQTTYAIPENTKILKNGFLVLKRPETKITLNNDEDELFLFSPDGKLVDSANYSKAPSNQSYNKTNSKWQWSLSLTPGAKNIITALAKNNNALPKTEKSDKTNASEAGLAGLSQANSIGSKISNGKSPWFLFFTALALTIISASTVLFIKFRFRKRETPPSMLNE